MVILRLTIDREQADGSFGEAYWENEGIEQGKIKERERERTHGQEQQCGDCRWRWR